MLCTRVQLLQFPTCIASTRMAPLPDRWSLHWPDDSPASLPINSLGDHSAARYRRLRHFIETLEREKTSTLLFGLLLSVESLRDELSVYEKQTSLLTRLAQTGHFVQQLHRLHGALDAAAAAADLDEPDNLREWEVNLKNERETRMEAYQALLTSPGFIEVGTTDQKRALVGEIDTDTKAEEVMSLLKFAIGKYGPDVLTHQEIQVMELAFNSVVQLSGLVVLSLPSWFKGPFEFGSTFGLSRWGNDLFVPAYSDQERFIKDASMWSGLNHPHVAKFLGACHLGNQRFIAHEQVKPLSKGLAGKTDHRSAWNLIHDVGLALQYLQEKQLRCKKLDNTSVFCAEYEDRAVILGCAISESPSPVGPQCPLFVAADLGVLILNTLRLIEPLASTSIVYEVKTASSRSIVVNSIPLGKPEYVHEEEWAFVEGLRARDVSSKSAVAQVIKEIARFAGKYTAIESKTQDVDRISQQVLELTTMQHAGDIFIASLESSVAQAIQNCCALTGSDPSITQLTSRLTDVLSQLTNIKSTRLLEIAETQALRLFVDTIERCYHIFGLTTHLNASNKSIEIPASQMFALHSEIDKMIEIAGLENSGSVHSWKQTWVNASASISSKQLASFDPSYSTRINDELLKVAGASREFIEFCYSADSEAQARGSKLPVWYLPPSEVDFESYSEFSRGAFGSVHFGKWFDTPVVVKRVFIDGESRESVESAFHREANVWFMLNHINVVKMYGACHVGDPFFVCEFASGGDLDSYLDRKGRHPYLIWYTLLNTALGLQYLHENGIVHADLKANNILVGGDEIPKLTDFGLSTNVRENESAGGGGAVGAFRWKAPECLPSRGNAGQPATFASDVYSFAMVIIEVVTGAFPWGNSIPDAAVSFHVKKGKLPLRPPEIADNEWRLIERMCCFDPAQRVTIDAVVVHLLTLVERLEMKEARPSSLARKPSRAIENRVLSRDGVLFGVLDLAASENKKLAALASDQIIAVHMNRSSSSQREIDKIITLLANGNAKIKEWAAEALESLAWGSSGKNAPLIVAGGAVPLLMKLVQDGTESQRDNALGALANLAVDATGKAQILSVKDSIPTLVELLQHSNESIKTKSAGALANLSSDAGSWNVITSAGGVPPLVELVRSGSDDQKVIAATALGSLVMNENTERIIVAEGAIPILVTLTRQESNKLRVAAAGVLANLCKYSSNQIGFAETGGIQALVEMVKLGDDDGKEIAAGALKNIGAYDGNHCALVTIGAVPALMELLRKGNDGQKEQAAAVFSNLTQNDDAAAEFVSEGGIPLLLDLVRDGNTNQKLEAAGVLWNLATNTAYKRLIGTVEFVVALVAMVRDGNPILQYQAAGTFWNLAYKCPEIAALIVERGGVDALVMLVKTGSERHKLIAAGALGFLEIDLVTKAEIAEHGGIAALLDDIAGSDDDEVEEDLFALASLCRGGGAPIHEVLKSSDATLVLYKLSESTDAAVRELACAILDEALS